MEEHIIGVFSRTEPYTCTRCGGSFVDSAEQTAEMEGHDPVCEDCVRDILALTKADPELMADPEILAFVEHTEALLQTT